MPLYNTESLYNDTRLYNVGFIAAFVREFNAEINRLANGGVTYPANTAFLGLEHAANVWAGTTGKSLMAALNFKNGTVGLGFGAVCNALAGTTGLSPMAAIRQVSS